MPPPPINRGWLWAALVLTAIKLWLTGSQSILGIGPAVHDDQLFVKLAGHIINGEWLGPYDQYTLAKGPLFSVFIAAAFWLGVPLLLAQQVCYAVASAALTRALAPWLRTGPAQFSVYALLLWNPMSYDAGVLSRLMRQNIYAPLALLVIAGLVQLYARRRESWRRQAGPAALAGVALGCFWLTREESVWLLPAVGLLLFGLAAALGRELVTRWRALAASLALLAAGALLPILVICSLNLRHYGWFGTVEFQSSAFKAAYGALSRLQVGPELPQVPVTRQMREKAYELSPAFARLRPYFETFVTDNWSEKTLFPAAERQIRGGWFIWAFRDAVVAAGIATDAGSVLRYYQQVADEVNAACAAGRVAALPPRHGFVPRLSADLTQPLIDGALEYTAYFIGFKGFSAYTPDSQGDYAELKPFRDYVGTRLSPAPRSPFPLLPAQSPLDDRKLDGLNAMGRGVGGLLAWLGPLVLLIGVVRGLESLADRRVSFPLWLAAALLAACAAYLTVNVLVHVTSFANLGPAAMAAAYPLYLVALVAIVIDALQAWRQAPAAAPAAGPATAPLAPSRWLWLGPAGVTLLVFAARLREIHFFAGDVPYNDQWIIEGEQLLGPWLNGTLRPWTFFIPHFEHLPVWTRLLAWLEVVITGRWDPLVQMTVNAGLHATFIWCAARWVWRTLSLRAAGFVTLMLILGGALPHAWENIAWGFQSQFPLALIFLFWHVHGTWTHPSGSRAWWLAQAAGVAGLFTLASAWLAPLAVVAAHLWLGGRDQRGWVVPLAIALLGVGLLAFIHFRAGGSHTFAQNSISPMAFFHSAVHLLGWPGGLLPGALVIVQLPWLLHALRLRGQAGAVPFDRIVFTLGLWNCGQALALAFVRAGDTSDYVSRYGDLLFIGVFASALALTRLTRMTGRARTFSLAATVVWGGVVSSGLFFHSTEGHARYFHQTSGHQNQLRRDAVQAYLKNGDKHLMETHETRWALTQSTGVMTALLDQPAFRALLPASLHPANPPDLAGRLARALQARWAGLLLLGALLLAGGFGWAVWRGAAGSLPLLEARPDPWPGRIALAIGLVSTAGLFAWANPLTFSAAHRWQQRLGGGQAMTGLTFEFATDSPYGPERLQGAAPLSPFPLRNLFFGTAPDGPEQTGTVLSSPFVLSQPWLVVPYSGYPVGHGNGVRLRLLDAQDRTVGVEIGCPGPNLDGIAYWPIEVSQHVGQRARLVLYDGRTDTEAWVAVAPPIPTDDPELASRLARQLLNERHVGLHTALGIIGLAAFLGAGLAWWNRRP